jgi:hypothetical protein
MSVCVGPVGAAEVEGMWDGYANQVGQSIDVQKMNCELPFGPQHIAVLAHDGKDLAG